MCDCEVFTADKFCTKALPCFWQILPFFWFFIKALPFFRVWFFCHHCIKYCARWLSHMCVVSKPARRVLKCWFQLEGREKMSVVIPRWQTRSCSYICHSTPTRMTAGQILKNPESHWGSPNFLFFIFLIHTWEYICRSSQCFLFIFTLMEAVLWIYQSLYKLPKI